MTKAGLFISVEGGEGVGKSTNVRFLQQWLEARAIDCLCTREPGGTPLAEDIRQLLLGTADGRIGPLAELLLLFAARSQHLEQRIKPALAAGQWVLCDRFTDASYAYQGGGRQLPRAAIAQLEQLVQGDLRPDVTLLLDAPVAVGMARADRRGSPDRFEREQRDFFQRIRDCYLERAAAEPQRFRVIDARQSPAAIRAQLTAIMDTLLAAQHEPDTTDTSTGRAQ